MSDLNLKPRIHFKNLYTHLIIIVYFKCFDDSNILRIIISYYGHY
jgi:hypothetical protein